MLIVTGAAGFIGSCLTGKLNNKGLTDLILVDDFSRPEKSGNYARKSFREKVERSVFIPWLEKNHRGVEAVLHLGARTDTAEFDRRILDELNLDFSKKVWTACTTFGIPLIYASSAATYGDGALGYDDDPAIIPALKPLNPYGVSKNEFDKWVLLQGQTPPFWYGLKFFNVFGPNEYHKGRMASVVYHAYRQISGQWAVGSWQREVGSGQSKNGKFKTANHPLPTANSVRLFRSHCPDYPDGGQLRDFIYVKDVVDVIWFLLHHKTDSGIYNLGTGKARTFLDLANAVFLALELEPNIEFIDTPADIRDKYQYFTEARMEKLHGIGYNRPFHTLEEGITEYVQGYLAEKLYF